MWILAGFCLIPWLWLQAGVAIPADMAWLSMAAEKFLDGQRLTEAFHDNNPPLCYLVYIPVALLTAVGVPLWTAGFLYALGLFVVFAVLLAIILVRGHGLGGPALWAVMAGYVIPLCLLMQVEFGNKDHLIAAALLPFVMAQLCVGRDTNLPRAVMWMTFILAVPFLLMKPHYGLMPACILALRFIRGRGFRVMADPDFTVLAAGTIIYTAIVMFWFDDYVRDVLVAVGLGIYAGIIFNHTVVIAAAMVLFSACLCVLAYFVPQDVGHRRVFIALSLLSLVSIVPFAVQLKGFSLHMIPTMVLMLPAAILALVTYCGRTDGKQMLLVLCCVAAGYGFTIMHPPATHDDIRQATLTRYVAERSGLSGFLMQDSTTNIAMRIAVYSGYTHASRFSSLWFIPAISGGSNPALTESYGRMMAEDLERFRPGIVALYEESEPAEDVLAVFDGHPAFQQAWAQYRRVNGPEGLVPIRHEEFYKRKNLLQSRYNAYRIYRRIED